MGWLLRWIPAPLQTRRCAGWFGVGVLIRLLIAPFTVSADLLAVYWRSHLIAYDHTVFASYMVNMGSHYTHALSLLALDPLLPHHDVLWADQWWWNDLSLSVQVQDNFLATPSVFWTLLVLKLPYALFDLAAGIGIVLLVSNSGKQATERAWMFWMLSPIGLYATYAFGRYEMFAVALVVWALWLAENDREWWAAIALGIAVTMRGYPILLIPIFGLIVFRAWWKQAMWMGTALIPFMVIMVTNRMLSESVGEFATLSGYHTASSFLAYAFPLDGVTSVYLFPLGYIAVGLWLLGRQHGWWGTTVSVGDLWLWAGAIHGVMFTLTSFSPHYFAWVTPFVAVALARRPQWRGQLWLHLIGVTAVMAIADLLQGPNVTWELWAPVAPDLAARAPSLRGLFLTSGSTISELVGLLKTGFMAVMGTWTWYFLRDAASPVMAEPQARVDA